MGHYLVMAGMAALALSLGQIWMASTHMKQAGQSWILVERTRSLPAGLTGEGSGR